MINSAEPINTNTDTQSIENDKLKEIIADKIIDKILSKLSENELKYVYKIIQNIDHCDNNEEDIDISETIKEESSSILSKVDKILASDENQEKIEEISKDIVVCTWINQFLRKDDHESLVGNASNANECKKDFNVMQSCVKIYLRPIVYDTVDEIIQSITSPEKTSLKLEQLKL